MDKHATREERLAAKLRENLRRRKSQGKAQGKAMAGDAPSDPLAAPDSPGLSNPAADR